MIRSIQTKAALTVFVVGILPLLLAVAWIYIQGIASLKNSIGSNFEGIAQETARKVTLLLDNEVHEAQGIAHNDEVLQALRMANKAYQGMGAAAIQVKIHRGAALWKRYQEMPRDPSPLHNSAMTYLKGFYSLQPENEYNALFITDQQGVLVASINRNVDYASSTAPWWQKTYKEGEGHVNLQAPYLDPRSGRMLFEMSYPITDPKSHQTIGILKMSHDVDVFLKPSIFETRIGDTGHAMLMDRQGMVITCPVLPTGFHITDQSLTTRVTDFKTGWFVAENDAHGGSHSLVGHAPMAEFQGIGPLGWYVFIRQDPTETFSPITKLLYTVLTTGGLAVALLILLGIYASRAISRPIGALHQGVGHIGAGNLNYQLDIRTGDEIQELAEAFNQMTHRLKDSYDTLEQRVTDRTKELSALYAVAATVNRSLNVDDILYRSLDKIVETLRVEAGAIRLLDHERKHVTLFASRGVQGDIFQGGKEISIGEGISGRVAETGEPILIDDVETYPHRSEVLLQDGFKSMMCVPITYKDRVLGTLSIASHTRRAFTNSDLLLLSAIGDQMGTGIENATLYRKEQEMVEQLKEIDRFKSEFLSNVSHELRTPLTSIIGFAELLTEKTATLPDKMYSEYLRNMLTSSEHLLQMINNLLDLSKIEAGRMDLFPEEFDFEALTVSVQQIILPLLSKKNLHLDIRLEGPIPLLIADEGKVKQVLLNLLSNAIKFTPEGGNITVSGMYILPEGHTAEEDGYLQVSVSDSGIGIQEEHLNMIFDSFRQVDSSFTRKYSGTGIGLSLCKRFVQMHGGRIWAESEYGHWTRVTFTLPHIPQTTPPLSDRLLVMEDKPYTTSPTWERVTSHERTEPFAPAAMSSADGKSTVLVVEDDLQVSQLIHQYLASEGYEVLHAYHGSEVLEKAKACRPFAITLDIMLPGKDGWQVLQELKQDEATQDIPVIIVSIVSNRDLGFSLGATDYITKPIDKASLFEALQRQSLHSKKKRKPVNILVVDDDPSIVELLAHALEDSGYGVVRAFSGQQGIDLAIEIQPDLIVLDLMMPHVSGFDVINKLKAHPTAKNIPLVICTAKNLTSEEKTLLMEQSRHIVFKGGPIKDQILQEIHKLERLYPDKARMVDGLTGLLNHKYFQNRLHDEVEKARRYRKTFSLLMTNIDGFSPYNERWGIAEGDRILQELAGHLLKNIRSANSVSRYGGSTFTVILSDTTKESAIALSHRLKRTLGETASFRAPEPSEEPITISIGVATFFEDSATGEGLIRAAYTALEQAKRGGGNQVVFQPVIP